MGTIFLIWVVLHEIADRGRRLAPDVIGTAWFQRCAGLVLGLVLATGFLVALRRALIATGRGRLVNASLALVFAAFCSTPAVFHVSLADTLWQQAVQLHETNATDKARLPELLDKAWNGQKAEGRLAIARATHRLYGIRIGYRDEAGVGQWFEPSPEMVAKDEQRRRAADPGRAMPAFLARQAAHSVSVAYAYLFGVGVMLVGGVIVALRGRGAPRRPHPPISTDEGASPP